MKKLLCFLGILMGTIIIFASVVQGNSLKQIEIVTGEWNPYTGNQLANKGMASEIVNNVLNDMGYNVQLTFMPFYLGYNRTKQQEFDGTFPYIKTKEREKEMWFSNKLFDVNISFFYNESNRQLKTRIESGNIQQTSDLEPYCIGLIKGYKYGQNIENLPKKRIFNTEVTAFQGLLEADNLGIKEEDSCGDGQSMEILPAEQKVGETILANYFRDKRHLVSQIKQLQFTLPVHFIMPKSDPANEKLMEDFNRSLLKLKQNGVISAILTRYAQSQTASSGLVILNGPESHPLVIGYEPISTSSQCQINSQSGWSGFFAKRRKWQQFYDENCGYLIPKGTRALVVEWGEPFLKPGNIKIHDQMLKKTRVRILEGPLKDQELYVANIYISFE